MRLCLSLLLVASLACGGGGSDGDPYDDGPTGPTNNPPNTPPPSNAPSTSAIVEMTRTGDGYGGDVFGFAPSRVVLTRGGTVSWSNGTGFVHNVTFSGPNAPQNIADFGSGSRDRQFPSAGTFSYTCLNHASMAGEVVVQ